MVFEYSRREELGQLDAAPAAEAVGHDRSHALFPFAALPFLGASGIVAAHCHPSGDPTPSTEDLALTKRLKAAGDLLGIQLLDHVIVTDVTSASMRERGEL